MAPGQGANRLSAQAGDRAPGAAPVVAHPQAAIGVLGLPCSHITVAGLAASTTMWSRIRSVGGVDLRQPVPVRPLVHGLENPTVGGAQIQVVGLARHGCNGPRVPARRAHRAPQGLCRQVLTPAKNKLATIADASKPRRKNALKKTLNLSMQSAASWSLDIGHAKWA